MTYLEEFLKLMFLVLALPFDECCFIDGPMLGIWVLETLYHGQWLIKPNCLVTEIFLVLWIVWSAYKPFRVALQGFLKPQMNSLQPCRNSRGVVALLLVQWTLAQEIKTWANNVSFYFVRGQNTLLSGFSLHNSFLFSGAWKSNRNRGEISRTAGSNLEKTGM